MMEAIYDDHMNQYTRSYSHLPLAISLANDYNQRYQTTTSTTDHNNNIPMIDPATMIATAVGCTNVLYCALQGLLNPNDEVICFEPAFDIYSSQVRMAGGIPVYVPLRNNPNRHQEENQSNKNILSKANDQFVFDIAEFEAAITTKTKVILLNTPHNPTGKMFTYEELSNIATVVQKYPHITIISDEVYEHIVFDDDNTNDNPTKEETTTTTTTTKTKHISMATIPGMFEQTLTLSSSGKTFSCTGWKVGWAVGPKHLIKAITAIQQWVNYSTPTPNQHAIAKALQLAQQPYTAEDGIVHKNYYHWLASDYQRKRSLLVHALQTAGMKPIIPQGGFFIMADTSEIEFPYESTYKYQSTEAMPKLIESNDSHNDPSGRIVMPRDWALSRWLTEVVGVTAIPPSAFYSMERIGLAQNYLRFAFCKSDDTILQAQQRFQTYFGGKS
jgi:kynurenine---oxoglutarate transaminase / cysteine-S-conjugate beta-lyase / glutamine---phenylpyruvate transaminase